MMSLRTKFRANRARINSQWRCCFCCHVHTATIFFGMWNLLLQLMLLSAFGVLMRNPRLRSDSEPALPTPQSKIEQYGLDRYGDTEMRSMSGGNVREVPLVMSSLPQDAERQYLDATVNENLNKGVIVVLFTLAVTLMMVYGAVKGRASCLKPFFYLQVLDFCICSVKAVDYLCYLPDVHGSLIDTPDFPFHDVVMRMDPQFLAFLVLFGFLIGMIIKGYFIGVVWSCYKYLKLRQVRAQCNIHYIDRMTSQSLLNEPPDYETAVKKFPAPPPSYEVATAMAVDGIAQVENGINPVPGTSGLCVPPAGLSVPGPSTAGPSMVTVTLTVPSIPQQNIPAAAPPPAPAPAPAPFPSAVPTALIAVTGPNAGGHPDASAV